jgi:hypothetical protein
MLFCSYLLFHSKDCLGSLVMTVGPYETNVRGYEDTT